MFTPSLGIDIAKKSFDVALVKERGVCAVSYTHLRAHETVLDLVCRLLLEKKKKNRQTKKNKKKKQYTKNIIKKKLKHHTHSKTNKTKSPRNAKHTHDTHTIQNHISTTTQIHYI